jgi:hypothetical protein
MTRVPHASGYSEQNTRVTGRRYDLDDGDAVQLYFS